MRIISKFRDYYDSAMAHGQDMSVVYSRTPVELSKSQIASLPFDAPKHSLINDLTNAKYSLTFNPFTIVFCGTVYRGIQVLDQKHPQYYANRGYIGECWYKLEELQEYLESLGFDTSDRISRGYKGGRRRKPFFSRDVEEFMLSDTDRHREFFVENRISILVATKRYYNGYYMNWRREYFFELDSNLSEFQFYRQFSAFAAYQELDMWVGGVLSGSGNPMATIADKYKIAEHGFDEWSFRRMPSKR